MLDAESLYYQLRDFALTLGEMSDYTDGLLGQVAESLASDNNDPREV